MKNYSYSYRDNIKNISDQQMSHYSYDYACDYSKQSCPKEENKIEAKLDQCLKLLDKLSSLEEKISIIDDKFNLLNDFINLNKDIIPK
jgi:hypothetical protein